MQSASVPGSHLLTRAAMNTRLTGKVDGADEVTWMRSLQFPPYHSMVSTDRIESRPASLLGSPLALNVLALGICGEMDQTTRHTDEVITTMWYVYHMWYTPHPTLQTRVPTYGSASRPVHPFQRVNPWV